MKRTTVLYLGKLGIGIAVLLAASLARMSAQQLTGEAVRIDNDDLGGVVTSVKGPEAGVWVIAETADLPTKFVKIVVTDDRGRYVVPDLPKANYSVWVCGYGLGGGVLSGWLLVLPDPAAGQERVPRHGAPR